LKGKLLDVRRRGVGDEKGHMRVYFITSWTGIWHVKDGRTPRLLAAG
jgi:hypothetical protein